MRPPGMLAIAVAPFGLLGQSAWCETASRHQQAKPKQMAQQQIICTAAIGGCREVKPGCWIEPMQSKFHDASGHQKKFVRATHVETMRKLERESSDCADGCRYCNALALNKRK